MAAKLAFGAFVVGSSLATAVTVVKHQNRHNAKAHCQVPCGIYDDEARIRAMKEDVNTIRKATQQINALSSSTKMEAISFNQATRWVSTKEQHASNIITAVSEYFLTQKLKDVEPSDPNYPTYLQNLAIHHKVLRTAMVTKQTVDEANVDKLQKSVEDLGASWGVKEHHHH